MMKATSPAAKSCPMQTEAMRARDTSTSALMSKAVTRPMTASRMMGTPQRMMATQARSRGNGRHCSRLPTTAAPEITSRVMSFLMLPSSRKRSSASMALFIKNPSLYTQWGMRILYPWGYRLSRGAAGFFSSRGQKKRPACGRVSRGLLTAYWRSAPPPW